MLWLLLLLINFAEYITIIIFIQFLEIIIISISSIIIIFLPANTKVQTIASNNHQSQQQQLIPKVQTESTFAPKDVQ